MACATSRTLAKVNSSLMTARQPSVPKVIGIGSVPRCESPLCGGLGVYKRRA